MKDPFQVEKINPRKMIVKIFIRLLLLVVIFIQSYFFAFNEIDLEVKTRTYVDSLSIEELVGQTIMVGYNARGRLGYKNSAYKLEYFIRTFKIGNIILFQNNFPHQMDIRDPFEIPEYISDLNNHLQSKAFNSQESTKRIPLLIAMDQEGAVWRIRKGVTHIPSHVFIGASRSERLAYLAGKVIGEECKYLGINTILAPVADINNNDENDIIGERAFGAHKEIVTPLCVQFMKGLQKSQVLSIGKHFPGHGNSKDDPHFMLAKTGYEDLSELRDNDLVPFNALIEEGIDGILTSHILAPTIDKEYPVTISNKAITQKLREKIQFKNLILTDDITFMIGALKDEKGRIVRDRYDVSKRALNAGHDIIIFGQISDHDDSKHPERTVTLEEFSYIQSKLVDFFSSNPKKLQNLKKSVVRILHAKHKIFGFINFNNINHWKSDFNKEKFISLVQKNSVIAREISDESAILISEDGTIIENIQDSKYFSPGKGPLSLGKLIERGDKICIASPVFLPPDELYELISSRWIPASDIDSVHMVYGWRTPYWIEQAENIWNEKIKRFSFFDTYGKIRFVNEAINDKVQQIIKAAENAKTIIIGIVTNDHIEILNRICSILQNNHEIKIIVLLNKEPYFLSKCIYDQKNTIVLYSSHRPDLLTVKKALFGELLPKGVAFLPISIPGKIHRQISPGEPVKQHISKEAAQTKKEDDSIPNGNKYNFFFVILGGIIGSLAIYLIPRKKLVWNNSSKTQYCITDFLFCILIGTIASALMSFLIPYINSINVGPVDFTGIKLTNPITIIIGVFIGFIFPALWLNLIKER